MYQLWFYLIPFNLPSFWQFSKSSNLSQDFLSRKLKALKYAGKTVTYLLTMSANQMKVLKRILQTTSSFPSTLWKMKEEAFKKRENIVKLQHYAENNLQEERRQKSEEYFTRLELINSLWIGHLQWEACQRL